VSELSVHSFFLGGGYALPLIFMTIVQKISRYSGLILQMCESTLKPKELCQLLIFRFKLKSFYSKVYVLFLFGTVSL
jgi:hypothetical protein